MSHPYDLLDIPGLPGKLIFTPCPGTRDTPLDEALRALKQAGSAPVGHVGSAVMFQARLKTGLSEISQVSRVHGDSLIYLDVLTRIIRRSRSRWRR